MIQAVALLVAKLPGQQRRNGETAPRSGGAFKTKAESDSARHRRDVWRMRITKPSADLVRSGGASADHTPDADPKRDESPPRP